MNDQPPPGQQDDARMCISIALTAAKYGATVLNHTKVVSLIKENLEKKVGDETKKVEVVTGAVVKNVLTGECASDWENYFKY